jgi:hypothetical protein
VPFAFPTIAEYGYRIVSKVSPSLRRWFHAALALLVVVSMGHCAWEWQAVLGQAVEAAAYRARNQSLPIMPQRGCHNETGCMCRGATQVVAVDVSHCEASETGWLPVRTSESASWVEMSAGGVSVGWFDPPPSLYGRQLRALLGSFVI